MTEQAKHKLYELRGKLDAMVLVAKNDHQRAVDAQAEMESPHYQGYFLGERDTHSHYIGRLEAIESDLIAILREVEDV